jgi:long-chain fatty acid transport protein
MMKTTRNTHIAPVLAATAVATVAVLAPRGAWADGFRNPPEGGAVLGRGGAHMVYVDDATAATHNPAALAEQKAAAVLATTAIGYTKTEFTSPSGMKEESEAPWTVLPAVYTVMPLKDSPWVIGMGLHVPYGQSKEWDRNGVFKFVAPYFAEMKSINVTPVVARKVGSSVSFGAGLDLMWSDLTFKQLFPLFPPPAGLSGPATSLDFEGDGYGVGAHAGLLWDVADGHRVALTYRSPVRVEYDGDFTMDPFPGPGVFPPPVTGKSDFGTQIDFPQVVGLGYGVAIGDSVRLEANVEWIEHSRNDALDLDIGNNGVLLPTTSLPQQWDDTWTFAVGGDWRIGSEWTARAGWTYLPTPVPDETMMPSLAEGDKQVLGIGLGYAGGGHRLDIAYALNLQEDRNITSPLNPTPGSYEFNQHLFAATYALTF